MWQARRNLGWPVLTLLAWLLAGCAASPTQQDAETPSEQLARLAPCPALPNCVLSDA
jgi:uncharacterized protein (DUF1499 family)